MWEKLPWGGGALWQRCDKWAGPELVRGRFERLCKFDALCRIRPEAESRRRSTRIPAPNLRLTETGEKGEGEKGSESVERERKRERGWRSLNNTAPPSRAASVALRSRGSRYVVEFKAECERCRRKREILERTHVIGSADRPPGKVRHLCGRWGVAALRCFCCFVWMLVVWVLRSVEDFL